MKDRILKKAWDALSEPMKRDLVYLDRYTNPNEPRRKVGLDARTGEALVRRGLAASLVGWRITAKGVQVASHCNETYRVPGGAAIESEPKVVVSVWKCEGCGAMLDDQGVMPGVKQLVVQGGWTWEDGKWTHFCPDQTVSEVVKVR